MKRKTWLLYLVIHLVINVVCLFFALRFVYIGWAFGLAGSSVLLIIANFLYEKEYEKMVDYLNFHELVVE